MIYNNLAFSEIEAWCKLRDIRLKQWELDAVVSMDHTRIMLLNKASAEASKPPEENVVSERPLSPELFAAIFEKKK